ncbi:MAG: hypothetical protein LC664_03190, partial [Flavobacteriales bacterium]|nr:hypothetical protein [Flavobacteriales bacterium]
MLNKRFRRPFLLILLLLFLGTEIVDAQGEREISLAEGLSQATVTCFAEDRDGFVWIGTKDGLNRYDAYSMKVIKASVQDTSGISSNHITCLELGKDGYLWVGTNFGLNRLNTRTMEVKTFFHWFEDKNTLSDNTIRSITQDREGNLWVGTANGLNRLKRGSAKFERYSIRKGEKSSLSHNIVNAVTVDSQNRVWVGTQSGLNVLDNETGSFKRYYHGFDTELAVENNQIYTVEEWRPGTFLIGTRNGVFIFDEDSKKFTPLFENVRGLSRVQIHDFYRVARDEILAATVSGAYFISVDSLENTENADADVGKSWRAKSLFEGSDVLSLFYNASHLVWLGTESEGVITIDKAMPEFTRIDVSKQGSSSSNRVYAMAQHSDSAIWAGTAKGIGLISLTDSVTYSLDSLGYGALESLDVKIRSILNQDSLMWFGTDGNGLVKYEVEKDSLTYYLVSATRKQSISSNQVNQVISGRDGTLWVSTQGGGICHFHIADEVFSVYRFDGANRKSIRDNNVYPLILDSAGNVWAGTGNAGLYKINVSDSTLLSSADFGNGVLSASNISDLKFDNKGNLWIATLGEGLFVYEKESQKFQLISNRSDRINDVVHALFIDEHNRVWKSTNAGISVFDPSLKGVSNFNNSEFVSHNQHYPRSVFALNSDHILFGGTEGITSLNITGFEMNSIPPPVVIVDCQELGGMNAQADLGNKAVMDSLILDYNHSGFQVEFAALNFKEPEKNHYQYRLVGLFNQWRNTGDRRFATFSNLNPGLYKLEVRASNNDGIWNDTPTRMFILVNPAFWQTLWFRLLSVLAVLGFLYLFYGYRISLEKDRRSTLESAVDQRTREIAEERDTNAILL